MACLFLLISLSLLSCFKLISWVRGLKKFVRKDCDVLKNLYLKYLCSVLSLWNQGLFDYNIHFLPPSKVPRSAVFEQGNLYILIRITFYYESPSYKTSRSSKSTLVWLHTAVSVKSREPPKVICTCKLWKEFMGSTYHSRIRLSTGFPWTQVCFAHISRVEEAENCRRVSQTKVFMHCGTWNEKEAFQYQFDLCKSERNQRCLVKKWIDFHFTLQRHRLLKTVNYLDNF